METQELRRSTFDDAELVDAGEQALHHDGDLRTARTWFDLAYAEARRSRDTTTMARAALGLGGLWLHEHRSATEGALVRSRQETALRALPPGSPLALRLRVRLAAEADYQRGGQEEILALLPQARVAGDPVAYVEALSLAHHCVLGPGQEELRRRLSGALVEAALAGERRGDLLMGLLWQTVGLFLADDPHARRRLSELEQALATHDHLAVGYVVRAIHTMLAIRAGRFEQAESLSVEGASYGRAAGDLDVTGWRGAQLVAIRWFQGRVGELLPTLANLVHSPALSAVDNSFVAAHGFASAVTGDRRQAAASLARLGDLGELPRSSSWLVTMYGVVETAHLLGDTETAGRAYALLRDCADLPMIASLGAACFGSTRHALGVAALTAQDPARAVDHLRAAVRHNLALEHWPAAALSRWRLARGLALTGAPGDAATVAATVRREATDLGMVLPDNPARPGRSPRGGPTNVRVFCRREGRSWQVSMGDHAATVAHSVGLAHLAVLLANPGHEIPAIDLVAGGPGTETPDDSAQPVLDERARRQYRDRMTELDTDIDEAEAANDLERAARLRGERDWLISELTAATGLAGRTRHFTDAKERARVAVSKAVRRAVDRIERAEPAIGAELKATVQTGLRCSYRPRVISGS